jgi:hypothetical protein
MSNMAGGCSPPRSNEGYDHPQPYRTFVREIFAAPPKTENLVTESKAKERLSDRRRFILHQRKTKSQYRIVNSKSNT